MKIGFDYWQCISHYPEQLGAICDAMYSKGHLVVVISAVGEQRAGTVAKEIIKYWPKFPKELVHEVVFDDPKQSPELKLAKCQELGVDMFFDDRDDVCRLLNKNGILALRVTRKDNSTYDLGAERS